MPLFHIFVTFFAMNLYCSKSNVLLTTKAEGGKQKRRHVEAFTSQSIHMYFTPQTSEWQTMTREARIFYTQRQLDFFVVVVFSTLYESSSPFWSFLSFYFVCPKLQSNIAHTLWWVRTYGWHMYNWKLEKIPKVTFYLSTLYCFIPPTTLCTFACHPHSPNTHTISKKKKRGGTVVADCRQLFSPNLFRKIK